MNKLWKTYGCTKCDKYPLLVIMFNIVESKEKFKSDYLDKHNVECIAVAQDDGGEEFNTVLENDGWGGPMYLIKPDKSVIGECDGTFAKEKDVVDAGITPHNCNTSIASLCIPNSQFSMSYNQIKSSIALMIPSSDHYSLILYSISGQQTTLLNNVFLTHGIHYFSYPQKNLSSKSYILEIRSSQTTTCKPFLFTK